MKLIALFFCFVAIEACNTKNNSMSEAPDTSRNHDQQTIAVGGPQQTTGTSPSPSPTP